MAQSCIYCMVKVDKLADSMQDWPGIAKHRRQETWHREGVQMLSTLTTQV